MKFKSDRNHNTPRVSKVENVSYFIEHIYFDACTRARFCSVGWKILIFHSPSWGIAVDKTMIIIIIKGDFLFQSACYGQKALAEKPPYE